MADTQRWLDKYWNTFDMPRTKIYEKKRNEKTIWKIKVEKKKNCILLQNVRRITRSVRVYCSLNVRASSTFHQNKYREKKKMNFVFFRHKWILWINLRIQYSRTTKYKIWLFTNWMGFVWASQTYRKHRVHCDSCSNTRHIKYGAGLCLQSTCGTFFIYVIVFRLHASNKATLRRIYWAFNNNVYFRSRIIRTSCAISPYCIRMHG